ncbi:hypothetical protein [Microbacterium sp. NIBRBAC000506063]|uniref:hypothetical protein n=1 Tax=Microbacterium sp. NIBRBAC000506063 TaxID=2734618 RepID=UPI001BB7C8C8|nr:hypothetical protein [Microbacterium sp. NIBRBAC000506063]QTV80524.1 hypothetical protein KAE78_06505 [Microbacterium sp. NIBRBAC000506063]
MLTTDDELRELLDLLLLRANRRQMWLLFIDELGRLGDPLMPMDDYPEDPRAMTTTGDLGDVSQSHLLMHRMGLIREAIGHESVVLVWERIGGSAITDADRCWGRAMAEEARLLEIPLRAQFVLHSQGIRQLHPDDYL